MSPPEGIDFLVVRSEEAGRHMDELAALYREIYAEPPYEWGTERSCSSSASLSSAWRRDFASLKHSMMANLSPLDSA